MTTRAEIIGALRAQRVIPVLRLESAQVTRAGVQCLHAAGFRVFEITMTTPGALQLIGELAETYPDSLIGAGTILDQRSAHACLEAGARFLVSPCLVAGVTAIAHRAEAASLPGAFTPGEVLAAVNEGADVVKVFPASSGGAQHLSSLRAIFPDTLFCPTGGLSAENAGEYFAAGAAMVGIGNNILDRAALARGEHAAVTERARGILNAAIEGRK